MAFSRHKQTIHLHSGAWSSWAILLVPRRFSGLELSKFADQCGTRCPNAFATMPPAYGP
jgi:hypothetical protein